MQSTSFPNRRLQLQLQRRTQFQASTRGCRGRVVRVVRGVGIAIGVGIRIRIRTIHIRRRARHLAGLAASSACASVHTELPLLTAYVSYSTVPTKPYSAPRAYAANNI